MFHNEINMDIDSPKFNFFKNPFEADPKKTTSNSINVDLSSKQNVFAKKVSKSAHSSVNFKKGSRLNSYDTEILEQNSLKNPEDKNSKTQFMIKEIESKLAKLEKKIAEKSFFSETEELQKLFDEKRLLQENLVYLKMRSSKKTFFKSMTGAIVNFLANENLPSVFAVFQRKSQLNEAIARLNDVEYNLYELLNSSVPHGEMDTHYNKLAKEISKAGHINSKLDKM